MYNKNHCYDPKEKLRARPHTLLFANFNKNRFKKSWNLSVILGGLPINLANLWDDF